MIKYYVEYVENGVMNSDTWSEKCLNEEIKRGEVEITYVEKL